MAKRQIRIPSALLSEKWSEVSGKKVNIVLNNKSVIFVTLLEKEKDTLQVQNMRLAKQKININDISEIIVDIKV